MNQFLEQLRITFRRDPSNWRPRINKRGSQKDQEQKGSGNFFFMDNVRDKPTPCFHIFPRRSLPAPP